MNFSPGNDSGTLSDEMARLENTRPAILLVGNGSYLNRGCEAIVRGTVKILRTHFPDTPIEHVGFVGRLDYDRQHVRFWKRIVDRATDIVLPYPEARVSVGDCIFRIARRGLLRTRKFRLLSILYRSRFTQFRPSRSRVLFALQVGGDNYSLDYGLPLNHLAMDYALERGGVPYYLWGASVGPFSAYPSFERWMAEHLRTRIAGIFCREARSAEYLRTIGLNRRVFGMADPGYLMDPLEPKELVKEEHRFAGGIGVNLSCYVRARGATSQNDADWIKQVGSILKAIQANFSQPLVLVPHVTVHGGNDHDLLRRAAVAAGLRARDYYLAPEHLTAPEVKWVISKLSVLVAARTHATIAAFSTLVPTISVGYSIKAIGINEQLFGDARYVLNAGDLGPVSCVAAIRRVLSERDAIRMRLTAVIPDLRESALAAGIALKRLSPV